MPIFPSLKTEKSVRANDRFRLDVSGSYKTPDVGAYTAIQIKPDTSDSFYNVQDYTNQKYWYLDYQYAAAGTKTVTVRFTISGPTNTDATFEVECVDAADDVHFATDQDLMAIDADIMKYVKLGRNSHLDVHREVTNKILDEIYKNKIVADDNTKLTIDEVVDVDELKEWAKYYALEMIYASVSNIPGDVFELKSQKYSVKRTENMNLSFNVLKLDYDKSGTLTTNEMADHRSSVVMKR